MSKNMNISFFQVSMGMNAANLSDCFEKLLEKEKFTFTDKGLHFHGLICKQGLYLGSISKIRMNALPERINSKTLQSGEIPLNKEDGLAESTAFLYDPRINIILAQKSQHGPSISNLTVVFENQLGALPIEFDVVIKKDALKKLNDMNEIKKIVFRIAKPAPDCIIDNANASALLDSIFSTGSINSEVKLSAGRKGTLTKWIKDLAYHLTHNENLFNTEKIIVTGCNEEGERDTLSLLKWKLEHTEKVSGDFRTLSLELRFRILLSAHQAKKDELYEMFFTNK